MAGDTNNPRIWLGGDVRTAPLGTTAPTNVTDDWPEGWQTLGLLSEDGLTENREEDSTDFWAWGNILVRTVRSKHKRTFTVAALEDNPVVFGLVNPGSEAQTADGVTSRVIKAPAPNPRAFGFETVDGAITRRIAVPRGEVTAVGTISSNETSMAMRELTITVYPAADGVLFHEITDDPAAVEESES